MVFEKVIVRVISGYAPQQSRKEEEKDRFYDDVSDEIGQAGLNEFVVLLGDLNGHVGADADGYEGVHGGWGYGIRNEEGRRVLELADAHSMVVGNTWFTREPARLITYRSGEHRSMIDYILVRAKHRKYVKNVKAIPGMLQHSMVVMDATSKEMGRRKKDKHTSLFYIYKTRLKLIQTSIKTTGPKNWTELVPPHLRAIINLQHFKS
ncbi:hypothetical protein HELRODRAFT_184211 [Helobdella robusta]|uniref:Endonuclease/exonuclease/phosphatase domain-containing protein n=1 Tax=Helobdella robusta TaxID=6412 RepID=T1FKR9_HELRO|nr:hypothetical protein HELRODRAFT_184211 [Helobdella robusta]ESO05140.1 hypothetical protein HELRODRAFT_184211 [Helobdella robusta]